jgi:Arc/MetJ-type ribon-helix-helix transcriptional regulator
MAITLPNSIEQRIRHVVESGKFDTPEEAMEFAVNHMERELQQTDDILNQLGPGELQLLIDEGMKSLETEPLVTPQEARAHLSRLRAELMRG